MVISKIPKNAFKILQLYYKDISVYLLSTKVDIKYFLGPYKFIASRVEITS